MAYVAQNSNPAKMSVVPFSSGFGNHWSELGSEEELPAHTPSTKKPWMKHFVFHSKSVSLGISTLSQKIFCLWGTQTMEGGGKRGRDEFELVVPFQYPSDEKSEHVFYGGDGRVFQDEDEPNTVYVESLEPMEQRTMDDDPVVYYMQLKERYQIKPWGVFEEDIMPNKMDFCPHIRYHNMIKFMQYFTWTKPKWYYAAWFAHREKQIREHQFKGTIGQINAGIRMMKFGSSPQPCDQAAIQVGDKVRVKMEALIRRPKLGREVAMYNMRITNVDGSPQWADQEFEVSGYDKNNDVYTLRNDRGQLKEYTTPEGFEYRSLRTFRRHDLCKFGQIKVGDVVRISMERIKKYRKFMGTPRIGRLDGLLLLHKFTRSLFIVTHIPDEGTTADGHTPPGIFVDALFPMGYRMSDDMPALYPKLTWETDEDVNKPEDYNPHSSGFYDYQMRLGLDNIEMKDHWRGFKETDLLRVDEQTQDLFWKPSHNRPFSNYADLREQYRGFRSADSVRKAQVYDESVGQPAHAAPTSSHPFLLKPFAREEYMRTRIRSYYRCLERLKTKNTLSLSYSAKLYKYTDKMQQPACMQQLRFGKFLSDFAFN